MSEVVQGVLLVVGIVVFMSVVEGIVEALGRWILVAIAAGIMVAVFWSTVGGPIIATATFGGELGLLGVALLYYVSPVIVIGGLIYIVMAAFANMVGTAVNKK